MILTRLQGGLGNQMFQYAAGLVLAKRLSSDLYMDTSWFDRVRNMGTTTVRRYELSGFGIKPIEISLINKISLKLQPAVTFKERGFGYNSEFSSLRGNILLDGYWQSYKYFDHYRHSILKTFEFPEIISDRNNETLSEINSSESVSVHVRRGDYAKVKKTKDYHGLLPIEYYKEASKKLNINHKNLCFFVFSDDPNWCKVNLNLGSNTVYVNNNPPDKGIEDMRLMAACKHNIIANSSFSWWGAWLGKNATKQVFAPKTWFLKDEAALDDRLPKNWIRL